jgi:hypothetical protein
MSTLQREQYAVNRQNQNAMDARKTDILRSREETSESDSMERGQRRYGRRALGGCPIAPRRSRPRTKPTLLPRAGSCKCSGGWAEKLPSDRARASCAITTPFVFAMARVLSVAASQTERGLGKRRAFGSDPLVRSGCRKSGGILLCVSDSASGPLSRPRWVGVGIWIGRVWKQRARQAHDVTEGVRHSFSEPLLNRGHRWDCGGARIADALRGRGRSHRFVRRRRLRRTPLSLSNWFC